MHANPTLFSVLVVTQRDDLLQTAERLNFFEVDSGGTQAFGILDLVPVKNFELEVRPNARWLKWVQSEQRFTIHRSNTND